MIQMVQTLSCSPRSGSKHVEQHCLDGQLTRLIGTNKNQLQMKETHHLHSIILSQTRKTTKINTILNNSRFVLL